MTKLFDEIRPESAYQAVEDEFLEKRSQSTSYASTAETREKSGLGAASKCEAIA